MQRIKRVQIGHTFLRLIYNPWQWSFTPVTWSNEDEFAVCLRLGWFCITLGLDR